jgi:phospho-N-acetylmuramoyl-pentapeptide-transferase
MGDTGSLTIGGIIAVLAIAVRKELLIPVVFFSRKFIGRNPGYFKYTKNAYEGRRIFLMAPASSSL